MVETLTTAPTTTPLVPYWHFPAPTDTNDPGQPGWISFDPDYYYAYLSGQWKRIPISTFIDVSVPLPSIPELVNFYYIDAEYYYIYVQSVWKRVPLTMFSAFSTF